MILDSFFRYILGIEYGKRLANGERDIYTLTAQSLGVSSTDCYPIMTWKEYNP